MGVMRSHPVSHRATSAAKPTRTIPPSLSPILTELELEAALVVSLAELAELVQRAGIGTEPRVVADRLRKLGWLLATETAGAWEFAPAAHAGPIGHGDPFLELRAARSSLDAAVCLTSALAAHRLAVRTGGRSPKGCDAPRRPSLDSDRTHT